MNPVFNPTPAPVVSLPLLSTMPDALWPTTGLMSMPLASLGATGARWVDAGKSAWRMMDPRGATAAMGAARKRPDVSDQTANRFPFAVSTVSNAYDLQVALQLRAEGYSKYGQGFDEPDPADLRPGTKILIAWDEATREPVGTMRVLDSRYGTLELNDFVDLQRVLPASAWPAAEATRLSVPQHPRSMQIKAALWKSMWLYARQSGIQSMVISVRKGAARDYQRLMFEPVGPHADYVHPELGGTPHSTYMIHVPTSLERFQQARHPMAAFFGADHANIRAA